MFRLLSKESNIFSIPVYLGFLSLIVILFNIFNFNSLSLISAIITFAGIALGYFLFIKIDLTYQTHLPLFFYTFFIFGLYPGYLDIGIAVSLLTNSFILLLLTNQDETEKNSSYLLVNSHRFGFKYIGDSRRRASLCTSATTDTIRLKK